MSNWQEWARLPAQLAAALGAWERGHRGPAERLYRKLAATRVGQQLLTLQHLLGERRCAELAGPPPVAVEVVGKMLDALPAMQLFPGDAAVADASLVRRVGITESQRRGIRAMCDQKGWPLPDDLDGWSKAAASAWMEQHDFAAWRDAHPRPRPA